MLRIMAGQPHASSAIATWADFLALGEDDPRELIDGILLEIDVPNKKHEWIVATLVWLLNAWVRPRAAGTVLASGYKIRVSEGRGVMPDVQYIRSGRESILGDEAMVGGAPDLVVEVVSASSARYDRVQKLAWYAAIGVGEYWIVDPDVQTLEQHVLGADGRFAVAATLGGGDVFRPELFPGLEVALADLWRGPAPASP